MEARSRRWQSELRRRAVRRRQAERAIVFTASFNAMLGMPLGVGGGGGGGATSGHPTSQGW
jgi:hypothetical protein